MSARRLTNSTVEICIGGEPVGSGFIFIDEEIIVTCAHVLPPDPSDVPITATLSESTVELEPIHVSPEPPAGGQDFAILQTDDQSLTDGQPLQPSLNNPSRGDKVIFCGYPFGLSDPLTHQGAVSGPHRLGFYIDGMVNKGNSGGPVINKDTGDVIGIITESKINDDQNLSELIGELDSIQQRLLRIEEVHASEINDINLEELAIETVQKIQESVNILHDNVSSGIGIGYSIEYTLSTIDELEIR